MSKLSISEMERRNTNAGFSWFREDTMRFFGTVIEAIPNVANIFITSEWVDFDETKRAYTLRWYNTTTNNIETLGSYLEYESLAEARAARKIYTQSKKDFGNTH